VDLRWWWRGDEGWLGIEFCIGLGGLGWGVEGQILFVLLRESVEILGRVQNCGSSLSNGRDEVFDGGCLGLHWIEALGEVSHAWMLVATSR
jgi:hypothetical protein